MRYVENVLRARLAVGHTTSEAKAAGKTRWPAYQAAPAGKRGKQRIARVPFLVFLLLLHSILTHCILLQATAHSPRERSLLFLCVDNSPTTPESLFWRLCDCKIYIHGKGEGDSGIPMMFCRMLRTILLTLEAKHSLWSSSVYLPSHTYLKSVVNDAPLQVYSESNVAYC